MEYDPCPHVCPQCGKCDNCCQGHSLARTALSAWIDNGPAIPEPDRKVYTHCGVWTQHGFWQMLPSTFIEYELPELSSDEQIEAARRYIQAKYNDEDPWKLHG